MLGSLQLLATRSQFSYAKKVHDELCQFPEFYENYHLSSIPIVIDIKNFADGEMEATVNTTVRGKDIFLFASSGRSHTEPDPARAKMILYHSIDAIKRAQPNRIVVFEPYCSPSRSDRAMHRSSVGLWIHFKTLVTLGVDKIITYQLHSDKSKSIIDPTVSSIEDVPATVLLMEYITMKFIKDLEHFNTYVNDNWLFCSVDAGGESLTRQFSKAFNTGLITSYKNRNYSKTNIVESVNILTATDITNKEIWIVDDMIDTGSSVETLIRNLAKYNVKKVHLAAIHPIFSQPSLEKLNKLNQQGLLDTLLVLDTIPHQPNYHKQYSFIHEVNSSQLTAQIVLRVHQGSSLSPFFDSFDINNFLIQLPYRQ